MSTTLENEVQAVCRKQPGLHRVNYPSGLSCRLEGVFLLNAQYKKTLIRDEYKLRIDIPISYPEKAPLLYEIGNRITLPTFEHRNLDKTLCLASQLEIRNYYRSDHSLNDFIKDFVDSYLFGYSYLEKYGVLPFGERAHGPQGEYEFLRGFLGIRDDSKIKQFIERVCAPDFLYVPSSKCPCGSGMNMGFCQHRRLLTDVSNLSFLHICLKYL